MGLFGNLLGNSKPYPESEPHAVLGILLAVVGADGDISDEEVNSILTLANNTKILGPMPPAEFDAAVKNCFSILRKEGSLALVDRCVPLVTPGNLRPLFVNACDLLMSDGRAEPEEEEVIARLQQQLRIDDAFAKVAAEFIVTKNSL